jgi:hypothetical protein
MGSLFTLLIGISLFIGFAPDVPSERELINAKAPKEQKKDAGKGIVIESESATITIAPGVTYTILPVKTAQGVMVRLTTPDVVIDASRLRIESKDRTVEFLIKDGELHTIQRMK